MVSCIRIVYCILCLAVIVTWSQSPSHFDGDYSRGDNEWNTPGISSAINDFQAMGYMESSTGTSQLPIIDILSTGSINRPDHQVVQEASLRQHSSVRHYFAVTELNDTETDCHSQLNWTQLVRISKKCRTFQGKLRTPFLANLVNGFARIRFLQRKANAIGWMCAQKRPVTALWQILQNYHYNDFPDYLFLLDDDTWIQLDALVPTLISQYPSDQPFFIAGCQIRFKRDNNFSFPFGGYGMIFTKAALQRWTQPLTGCPPFSFPPDPQAVRSNAFVRYSCERYHKYHRIGERIQPQLFAKADLSVADLLYAYVQRANYTDVMNWDGIGYCLHSDWALGYFANEYHITLNGQLQPYQDSHMSKGIRTGECRNLNVTMCPSNATICHYMTPQAMRDRMKNVTNSTITKRKEDGADSTTSTNTTLH